MNKKSKIFSVFSGNNKKASKNHKSNFWAVFPRGKKAMMDDMFDFLFTVFLAFFIFLIVGVMITGATQKSEDLTFAGIKEFKRVDSAINNLRVGVQKGVDLDPEKIGERIAQSKVLNGKIITECYDYTGDTDCTSDPIGVGDVCKWFETECLELKG